MSIPAPRVSDIFEQRYELLEVLGSGGIGTVFKARQIDANRLLALKILHAEIRDDEEFKARFLREAQSLNKLRHPNIVTLYHLGISADGLPYIAMELIEGVPLRKVLSAENKLSVTRAIQITKQLCSALSAMHTEGIVHRDLKPENIVLMAEPEADFAKIIDFGLVRVEGESDQQKLTATGFLLGSVNYMSPEQCRGLKVDPRSDIYALGICFYEMLTGKCPFHSDSPVGIMYKHNSENVPAIDRTTVQSYHPSINALIQRATEKKPEQRFQSAAEMANALDLLSDAISSVAARAWHETKAFRLSVIAIALITVLTASAVFIRRQNVKKESDKNISFVKEMPLYKAKGHYDLGNLSVAELNTIMHDPQQPVGLKVNAANRNSFINKDTPLGISLARASLKMISQAYSEVLPVDRETAELALAEALVCNGNFDEAKELLPKLMPIFQASPRKQYYLKLIALRAVVNTHIGQKKEALKDLRELAEWPYGLNYPTGQYTLNSAIALKQDAIAKSICCQPTKSSDALAMAEICRNSGHLDLAEICVQNAEVQRTDRKVLKLKFATRHDLLLVAGLGIEKAWLDIHHHDKAAAKKRIEDLFKDKAMADAISEADDIKKKIAEVKKAAES